MIVLTLSGGIGNQLFMYAAARALALRNGTELVLNIEQGFINDKEYKRHFELDKFNINYKTNRFLTFDYFGGKIIKAISRKIGFNIMRPTYPFLTDRTKNQGVDDFFFQIRNKNIYLEGYWQSELYFKDYAYKIKDDLRFDEKMPLNILQEEKNIFDNSKDETPVCLGVRTYQECKHAMSFPKTDLGYYIKAMDYIKKNVKKPVFCVFSQDNDWCLKNLLSLDGYNVKLMKEQTAYNDLYLMSKFDYHIISNSSFYWWGAWLSDSKLVISNKSFQNKESNCPNWIVL